MGALKLTPFLSSEVTGKLNVFNDPNAESYRQHWSRPLDRAYTFRASSR